MNRSNWIMKISGNDDLESQWGRPRRGYELLTASSKTCNICGVAFAQHSRFDRFCDSCRDDNDLYRYSGWATYS